MTTEISPDGFSMVHNGASVYINPVFRCEDMPEKYRVQVYKDGSEERQFYQTYVLGTLQDAQQCGIASVGQMEVAESWRPDTDDVSAPVTADGHCYTGYSEVEDGQEWFEVVDGKGNPYQTLERPRPEIVELICPQCQGVAKFTDTEIELAEGVIYCERHDVAMVEVGGWRLDLQITTADDFEAKVDAMMVHPDDFETFG